MVTAHTVVVSDLFPKVIDELQPRASWAAKQVAYFTYQYSQERVPVDTETLKKSGYIDDRRETVAVVYDAVNSSGDSYGGYVEYGTVHTRAQPFLGPAFEDAMGRFPDIASNLLASFE